MLLHAISFAYPLAITFTDYRPNKNNKQLKIENENKIKEEIMEFLYWTL